MGKFSMLCSKKHTHTAYIGKKIERITLDESEMDVKGGASYLRRREPPARNSGNEHCFARMCLDIPEGKIPVYYSAAYANPVRFVDDDGRGDHCRDP